MADRQLKSSIGVLLLDAHYKLVHHTPEAATILEYPKKSKGLVSLERVMPAIRTQLPGAPPASRPSREFLSGRRRYHCRAYLLNDAAAAAAKSNGRGQPSIVVLLERPFPHTPEVTKWCEAFHLTQRECETVKHLLQGRTSKEIAVQMNISPRTVKSFLKLVMTKMGASNRMGIIARILGESSQRAG